MSAGRAAESLPFIRIRFPRSCCDRWQKRIGGVTSTAKKRQEGTQGCWTFTETSGALRRSMGSYLEKKRDRRQKDE